MNIKSLNAMSSQLRDLEQQMRVAANATVDAHKRNCLLSAADRAKLAAEILDCAPA